MQTTDALELIQRRLSRLEARERRWRGLALLLALGSVACVTSALKSPPQNLEVQSLSLEDARGTTRAFLRMSSGQPWLSLYDAQGQGRIALCLDGEGEGALHAFKPNGEDSARWPTPPATH